MAEYVYQEYPRDLKNAEGKLREFKRKEDVPPGWFVRDTGEEVCPSPDKPKKSRTAERVAIGPLSIED